MSINLFQEALKSERTSKGLSLKKLCRYMDKIKGKESYDNINLKLLFDFIMDLPIQDQILFNSCFIQARTLKTISEDNGLSTYKVRQILQNTLKNIATENDLFS